MFRRAKFATLFSSRAGAAEAAWPGHIVTYCHLTAVNSAVLMLALASNSRGTVDFDKERRANQFYGQAARGKFALSGAPEIAAVLTPEFELRLYMGESAIRGER